MDNCGRSIDDRTALLVGAFAEEEPRVHVIRINEKERSAAHARNVAMKTARGEVFAFLDADDLWEPEKTEKQIHYMGDHPEADGVCSWYRIFGEASRVRNDHRMMRTARICQRSELLQGCPIFTSSLMMRRRCFEEIGDMNEDPRLRSGQDYEYFVRLISRFEIHRMPEKLARYRLGTAGESLSSRHMSADNRRGWLLHDVLVEKDLLTKEELRAFRSYLYYVQARDNLFIRCRPFRILLVRSIICGRPPFRAVIIFLLSFLPTPLLRSLLIKLQEGRCKSETRH